MTVRILLGVLVAGLIVWWLLPREAPMASGEAMVEVTVPDLSGAALVGKSTFDQNCAACHGDNAAGRDGLGPPLVHRIYEPGHHGDPAFFLAVHNGVRAHHWRFGNMPPVDGVGDEQIETIIAYVRTLQRANGIE